MELFEEWFQKWLDHIERLQWLILMGNLQNLKNKCEFNG